MRRFARKTLTVTAVAVLLGGGGAYAYWSTTGSGIATSTTATSLATLTAAQNGTVTAMAPGGAFQDVNYTITNSAATPQYVTSVALSISGITWVSAAGPGSGVTMADHAAGTSAVAAGCTTGDFTLTQPDAVGLDLAAGATAFTRVTAKKSGQIKMVDSGTNQDVCKGTTVALALAIT